MNIYKINNNKFKTIYFSYNLTIPVQKKDISYYNVLALVLSKSNKVYKDEKQIQEYLYSLYGANFDVNVEKIGDLFNIEFRMEFVNDKFIEENSNIFKKAVEFLYCMIYNSKLLEGNVDKEIVEREKQSVLEKIFTRKDDKLRYAVNRTEELLCKNEPFGTFIYGEEEIVKNVTIEELIEYYKKLINNSLVNVIISGNLENYTDVEKHIKDIFCYKSNVEEAKLLYNIAESVDNSKVNEVFEKADTVQSVITYGLRINNFKKEDFYVLNLYNAILGATPSSKLFQNFREKESLAYTVRSRYYRYKNFIIIYAGINSKNYEKAKLVLNKEIKDIELGNVTDEEFNAAKQSLITELLEVADSKISIAKMLISNLFFFDYNINIAEMIENIKKVKKEEVIDIAKNINLDLIYLLGGDQSE